MSESATVAKALATGAGLVPEATAEAAEAKAKRAFENLAVWADAFVDAEPPPRPALLAHRLNDTGPEVAWMPAGKVCLLASAGGKGKTAVALQLAGHVASGEKWHGLTVRRPGAVAVIVGEEDRDECHRRIREAWKSLPDDKRRLAARNVVVLPLAGTGSNRLIEEAWDGASGGRSARAAELFGFLERAIKDRGEAAEHVGEGWKDGWALVVFDPFSRFAGMEAETNNAAATRTMEEIERFTTLPGSPAVLVTHHTRKGSADSDPVDTIRGSSAIKDAARWAGVLESIGTADDAGNGRVALRVVKSNYTATRWGLSLATRNGIPTGGAVRPDEELRAKDGKGEAADPKRGSGGNAPATGSPRQGKKCGPVG
jgi:hypothetical protein